MKANPFISFIVPYYNIELHLLRVCVENLLSLPLNNDEREIIVVDDGSDISPADLLAKYADTVQLLHKENGGLSSARNAGLAVAKGEYIQFVDADDCLLTESYTRCMEILRQTNADMLLFKLSDSYGENRQRDKLAGPFSGDRYMLDHNLRGSACGYVFSSTLLGDLRFHEGILHEDEEFTPLLILRAKRLYVSSLIAYFYRLRPDSITQTITHKQWLRRVADMETVLTTLANTASKLEGTPRLALQRRVAQLTMDHLYHLLRISVTTFEVELHTKRLSGKGLFPLPDKNYTLKYTLFRLAVASVPLRNMLRLLLNLQYRFSH